MHMSVAVRKIPGMRMIHHDFVISALSAFESMLPHEICSNGNPIPMKLKVDSETIAYSLLRICRTSVRTIFAMLVQLVTPITTEIVTTFGFPRIACSKMTSSKLGTLSRISVRRISSVSSHCGAIPLIPPNTTAIAVEMTVDSNPIKREIRPPTRS